MTATDLTIRLTTDAAQDCTDAGGRNTPAAEAAFAAAWERAAVLIGKAAGFDIEADARASAPEMHEATAANYRELSHLDRDDVSEWIAAFWQAAHDCTRPGSRPGRWATDRSACKRAGERLRASFDRLT